MKFVYYFGDGQADGAVDQTDLLGGKGANLAEMTRLGLPVPPGFTITTNVCTHYMNQDEFPQSLRKQVNASLLKTYIPAEIFFEISGFSFIISFPRLITPYGILKL